MADMLKVMSGPLSRASVILIFSTAARKCIVTSSWNKNIFPTKLNLKLLNCTYLPLFYSGLSDWCLAKCHCLKSLKSSSLFQHLLDNMEKGGVYIYVHPQD